MPIYASNNSVIYILSRDNYNSFSSDDRGDNIFFVRENGSSSSSIVSLYVGSSKQTDVTIIEGLSTVYDEETNFSGLGSYQIENKLLLIPKEIDGETQFLACTYYDGSFHECGIPKNVRYYNYGDLPQESDAVRDFIYIVGPQQSSDVCSIYVFDGTEYVSLISPEKLVTIDYMEQNFARKTEIPSGDGTTIIEDQSTHILSSGFVTAAGNIISTDANGSANIISGTDVPLATAIKDDSTAAGSYTEAYLPRNGGEWRITSQISQLNISNISTMRTSDNSTTARTSDYLSVIIFKKASSLVNVADVMGNFTLTGANKIYLMNPDVDISSYTVIHILLYFDGFNMCAIVTGYQEISQP